MCSKKDAQTDKIAHYDEPMPSAVGSISEAMASGLKVHKLIVMAATETIDEIRPEVEQLIGAKATFTQVCQVSAVTYCAWLQYLVIHVIFVIENMKFHEYIDGTDVFFSLFSIFKTD